MVKDFKMTMALSLIVLNVSRPVIIKQPACLYSGVSQQGADSGGKTNTRQLDLSRSGAGPGRGDDRDTGDAVTSRCIIMSPPVPNRAPQKVMSHYKQSHCFHRLGF